MLNSRFLSRLSSTTTSRTTSNRVTAASSRTSIRSAAWGIIRPRHYYDSSILESYHHHDHQSRGYSSSVLGGGGGSLRSSPPTSPLSSSSSSVVVVLDRPYNHQQVRYKRHSGQSEKPKNRRWSKKQKKRHRKKVERQQHLDRHAAPGSRAGPRREYNEELRQSLIQEHQDKLDGVHEMKRLEAQPHPIDDPALEYNASNAMIDDLIGNARQWKAQPTPEPIYYGNQERFHYNNVKNQIEQYHQERNALLLSSSSSSTPPSPDHLLPEDQQISLAIRAFRDRNGTKQKPVGLAKALQYVLQDMGIPHTKIFGEYTYNALLSCCRTATEAVRIFQLMDQQQHPISPYSWCILIDIHAKVGDYEGCVRAMEEMHKAGHEPNLAAYTSLLAACYKVCNDGRIPHEIRAKAGEVGWEKWKEMRINGLEADVMAYGAILRLTAARGQPERCISLLEEMPRFDVKPTTLCFTAALKGIAKSHETSIRYERGFSKANRRRERLTAHHGKMAHNVVLLAESAAVEIDDGFIAALQLCAAAAGDSATAKAIYLAYKVRVNMKHIRTIGGEDHLARLRGEDPTDDPLQIMEGRNSHLLQLQGGGAGAGAGVGAGDNTMMNHNNNNYGTNNGQQQKGRRRKLSYNEREYGGVDTRPLSAILRACAQACSGVGTMWSGRENYGYLDLTSLRLIQEVKRPEFRNTDIPGFSRQEVGMMNMQAVEDMRDPRKRTDPDEVGRPRRKYEGLETVDDPRFSSLDDLPPEMEAKYFDEDGMLRQEFLDTGDYPEYERAKEYQRWEEEQRQALLDQKVEQIKLEAGENVFLNEEKSFYFSETKKMWIEGDPDPNDKYEVVRDRVRIREEPPPPAGPQLSQGGGQQVMQVLEASNNPSQLTAGAQKTANVQDLVVEAEPVPVHVASGHDAGRTSDAADGVQHLQPQQQPKPSLTPFEAQAVAKLEQENTDEDSVNSENDSDEEEEDFDEAAYERFVKAASKIEMTEEGKFLDPKLEDQFEQFLVIMKEEEEGEFSDMNEADARQFFIMTRSQFEEEESSSDAGPMAGGGDELMHEMMTPKGKFKDARLEMEFQEFFKYVMEDSDDAESLSEADARQFFISTRSEMETEGDADPIVNSQVGPNSNASLASDDAGLKTLPTMARGREPPKKEFSEIMDELKEDWGDDGLELDGGDWSDDELDGNDDTDMQMDATRAIDAPKPFAEPMELDAANSMQSRTTVMEASSALDEETGDSQEEYPLQTQSVESFLQENPAEEADDDVDLVALRQLLPGIPDSRLRRVKDAYAMTLSDPSLLILVPILRETMPDWYTIKTIKAANLRNAHFVMNQIEEAGLMNHYLLNGMMQVYTEAGSMDSAMALYQEYDRHNTKATGYSDRLVIQMFLKHNRWSRCLRFKQWVEERGRKLDILAYGSMIDHCSRKHQLGSALMVLKECIRVHGAPPGEAYLKRLRVLCRQAELYDELGIEDMIGKDPIEWLKHGEAVLKRDNSKKAWRNVQMLSRAGI